MNTASILARCTLFTSIPHGALTELAGLFSPIELAGGEVLFRKGDPSLHLYIVVNGRIRVQPGDGGAGGDVGRNEPLGEISLLSGELHSTDARALRDSFLLCIGRDELLDFAKRYPDALLQLSRVIVKRLRRGQPRTLLDAARQQQSIAVIALVPAVEVTAFSRRLTKALDACGNTTDYLDVDTVDAVLGKGAAQASTADLPAHHRLMRWLNEREQDGHHRVYCAGPESDAWTERCLRQCDRVVAIVTASAAPTDSSILEALLRLQLRVPVDLVVLRADAAPAGDIVSWRNRIGAQAHFFVRPDVESDYASLARQLSGCANGLVLGGGGARGFAHLGLLRALEELKIPVDLAGGTSMGAFFAALHANGLTSHDARQIAHELFVAHNYLNDYLLPRVSLIRGRRFLQQLDRIFGNQQIEDLRMPFFCVSTNLSQACSVVHDRGALATWVGTSMAVPGLVPPVAWHGDLLVDGAVTNSLPTDVMQALGRGAIIASDVSTEGALRAPGVEGPDPEALLHQPSGQARISLIDIVFGGISLTSESGVRLRAQAADLYLRMPVADIGLFDWKRIDEVIERGYMTAMQRLQSSPFDRRNARP